MTPDADVDPRDAIDEAIRANVAGVTDRGAVVTGWAMVVELMDEDGRRWLARAHAETTPPWAACGMWHEALYGAWPHEDDDEDED
jgi:hypothetical protein